MQRKTILILGLLLIPLLLPLGQADPLVADGGANPNTMADSSGHVDGLAGFQIGDSQHLTPGKVNASYMREVNAFGYGRMSTGSSTPGPFGSDTYHLNNTGQGSFSAWVRFNSFTTSSPNFGGPVVLSGFRGGCPAVAWSGCALVMSVDSATQKMRVDFWSSDVTCAGRTTLGVTVLKTNVWYHMGVLFRGGSPSGAVALILNGTQENSGFTSSGSLCASSLTNWSIGADFGTGTNDTCSCDFDDVRIWNSTLSNAQMTSVAGGTFNIDTTHLMGSYQFEENGYVLGAPTLLALQPQDGGMGLSFTKATNSTKTNVYYSTATHSAVSPMNTSAYTYFGTVSGSTATVTGLTNGVRYYFRVVGVNDLPSEGPASGELNATPAGVPSPPVLNGSTSSQLHNTLNWSTPANGSLPIQGYNLTRWDNATQTNTVFHLGLVNTYTDDAVTTPRWYTVTAWNMVGTGPASNNLSLQAPHLNVTGNCSIIFSCVVYSNTTYTGNTTISEVGGRAAVAEQAGFTDLSLGLFYALCATLGFAALLYGLFQKEGLGVPAAGAGAVGGLAFSFFLGLIPLWVIALVGVILVVTLLYKYNQGSEPQ